VRNNNNAISLLDKFFFAEHFADAVSDTNDNAVCLSIGRMLNVIYLWYSRNDFLKPGEQKRNNEDNDLSIIAVHV